MKTKTEIDEALEAGESLEDALEDARWERDLARDYLEAIEAGGAGEAGSAEELSDARAHLAMCEADVAVLKKRALRSLN